MTLARTHVARCGECLRDGAEAYALGAIMRYETGELVWSEWRRLPGDRRAQTGRERDPLYVRMLGFMSGPLAALQPEPDSGLGLTTGEITVVEEAGVSAICRMQRHQHGEVGASRDQIVRSLALAGDVYLVRV